jgi:hypothetical protein
MIIAGLPPARTPAVSAATRKLSVNSFAWRDAAPTR